MKLVTLIFLFAISKWSYAQIFHLNDTLYVFTSNGINLRDLPSKEGKITKKIKYGEKLIVTGLEDVFDEIDKREGRWLHVKLNKTEGYIFSGFCSKHIPPSPPLDSFELQNHFIDWLSSTTKNDTLIHKGQRTIKGYDGDGKDWASIN